MKNELNNYNITNADASKQSFSNEGKLKFDNDKRDFIRESVSSDSKESFQVAEAFEEKEAAPAAATDEQQQPDLSELSSASSSSAASSVASASASVGGSVGALAGVLASSVVAAVVVVAVFLSTLAISLSLVIADMHSLTFEVTMTGADERDFEQPIYAILTGEDTYREQEVKQDTVLLTFDDLMPGKEYLLTIKNEEKVFAEVSACTTTEPSQNGEIVSYMQGTEVFVSVNNANLKKGEYYTLIGKDAAGNVVFSKDGVEPFTEYSFMVDEPKDLYFYLIVGGKTYAFSQIALPEFDFANGVWAWSEDNLSATVTFADKRGGQPLVLAATVTRKTQDATCEEDGSVVYTAKAIYQGKTYSKTQTTVLESLGHNYSGVYEDGQITYTCSRCGDTYSNED